VRAFEDSSRSQGKSAVMPSLEGWHDFFIAEVGASAALTGLLFVAISINVTRMIESPWLPPTAAQALISMIDVLITSSLALAPGQSNAALGIEVVAVNVLAACIGFYFAKDARAPDLYRAGMTANKYFFHGSMLTVAAGGALLIALPSTAGAYTIMAGILLAFVYALFNSWVLLVEILR
jgi:hypothetical protein